MPRRQLPEVSAIAEEIANELLAAPGRQRRWRSHTFWGKFGFKARTQERVAAVREALAEKGIHLEQPQLERLGVEGRDEWVVLTIDAPQPPRPLDDWFRGIASRRFESEREVESFFVIPLIMQLGYSIEDIAQGHPVSMPVGRTRRCREADFALFNGPDHTKPAAALLVVESKYEGAELTRDDIDQALSYAVWLGAPYYVLTNADEICVFENLGSPGEPQEVMALNRTERQARWNEFAGTLHKRAVVARKSQIAATLAKARTTLS